ncbi:MAG: HK97 family phage prohead protease [Siculibacillus sp.]
MTAPTIARLPRPPEVKRLAAKALDLDADGTFTGHACLFGVEDLAHDVIEPGAFRASLARRGVSGVKMLWHHEPAEPIGAWIEIREDARGLFVRGRLLAEVARGREAIALMRAGVLDGLSIGFRAVRASRDRGSGVRRLTEIDLWEISLVTFPMQPRARVAAIETTRGIVDLPASRLAATIRRATALLDPKR